MGSRPAALPPTDPQPAQTTGDWLDFLTSDDRLGGLTGRVSPHQRFAVHVRDRNGWFQLRQRPLLSVSCPVMTCDQRKAPTMPRRARGSSSAGRTRPGHAKETPVTSHRRCARPHIGSAVLQNSAHRSTAPHPHCKPLHYASLVRKSRRAPKSMPGETSFRNRPCVEWPPHSRLAACLGWAAVCVLREPRPPMRCRCVRRRAGECVIRALG